MKGHVDQFAAAAWMERGGYMLGVAHATLVLMAEAHTNCVEPGCRQCTLLGDAVAQVLAAEQTYVDEEFADLTRTAKQRRPRWPWKRNS